MVHTMVTDLAPGEVLARAKAFFAERVPHASAFVEKEGPTWVVLRGQGGEEIAIQATADGAATQVRASTLLFDQAIGRFFSTLQPFTAEVA